MIWLILLWMVRGFESAARAIAPSEQLVVTWRSWRDSRQNERIGVNAHAPHVAVGANVYCLVRMPSKLYKMASARWAFLNDVFAILRDEYVNASFIKAFLDNDRIIIHVKALSNNISLSQYSMGQGLGGICVP